MNKLKTEEIYCIVAERLAMGEGIEDIMSFFVNTYKTLYEEKILETIIRESR